jgi:hypothetical protein
MFRSRKSVGEGTPADTGSASRRFVVIQKSSG